MLRRHVALLLLQPLVSLPDFLTLSLNFDQDFPGLPVVDEYEDEAGEGADQGHNQGDDGNSAGRTEFGNAAGKKRVSTFLLWLSIVIQFLLNDV